MTRVFLFLTCTTWCLASLAAETRQQSQSPGNAASQEHWSLKPIIRPQPPSIANKKWNPRNPIDNFVFAKLAAARLSPSPEASRRALIRRLYFDLIGLPPTPEEVQAFERDKSANAYEILVERLLASPHYGERWAQHWLDVVRFAESHGFEMNQPRATAWRYRDYVINAFNADKPYDRFILEQFAGDVLGEDAATGFLVAGSWDQVKSPDPVLTASQRADELHDMVSVTGSAFLGLTVGCARCHNHKFDPISQVDYYAIKACLAGVEHGDRKLRTPDLEAREQEIELSRKRLAAIEEKLTQFEPVASIGRTLLFEPEPGFGSRTIQMLKPATRVSYPAGTSRGERDDPGDLDHLPNFSRSYLAWSNAANADVFSCRPGVEGRFRIRLSWGCRSDTHARDARFILDRDGDLTTTNDQVEIARVDQQRFADGAANPGKAKLWSGFYEGGAWDLMSSNKIVLRGGATEAVVAVGVISLIEEPSPGTGAIPVAAGGLHFLRAPVNPRRNVDRFAPIKARFLRFTVARTTDAEPCIDELEVFGDGGNLALASTGVHATASSVFPNSDIHRIEHLNDGKYGNRHSWISNERGKGWVQLEFTNEVTINRVVWGRDREQQYSDRLALDYRIEVGPKSNQLELVATSQDRIPYSGGRTSSVDISLGSFSEAEGRAARELLAERSKLEARIKAISDFPMVYAGTMVEKPEPINRLQRGDPMQKREVVEPGGLSAVPVRFERGEEGEGKLRKQPAMTEDQQRRVALAAWIGNLSNPLPARVIVNRIWQHHFGEGLVNTPSDFGKKGASPTHPELLDWLASEFITPSARKSEPGAAVPWSIKHLHRVMVTSATYRQATTSRAEGMAADAGCRLLWRFPPQRLEAEPLRDAILAVSGKLDLRAGGPGFTVFETNDNYVRVYNPKKEYGPPEWRRMIYMTKVRMQQDSTFGAFDCPDGGQIAPKRMRSTTPLQALNLMNSNFVMQQSAFFADRVEKEAGKTVELQIRRAFELAYNRRPEPLELTAAKSLVATHGLTMFCRALFNSNEFIFLE